MNRLLSDPALGWKCTAAGIALFFLAILYVFDMPVPATRVMIAIAALLVLLGVCMILRAGNQMSEELEERDRQLLELTSMEVERE